MFALVYFVATLRSNSFVFQTDELGTASVLAAPIIIGWFHFMSGACARYHKTIREGQAISDGLEGGADRQLGQSRRSSGTPSGPDLGAKEARIIEIQACIASLHRVQVGL